MVEKVKRSATIERVIMVAGFVVTILVLLWSTGQGAGVIQTQIKNNTCRIEKVEEMSAEFQKAIGQLNTNLAVSNTVLKNISQTLDKMQQRQDAELERKKQ